MTRVGIRKLKAELSSYLRKARAGEVVQVTDRGEVVAELRPAATPIGTAEDRYRRLVAEGRVKPSRNLRDHSWARWKGLGVKWEVIQRMLDEDREDRF
jgi:prevent-host-death family protein